jgi:hypothetical protein
VGEQGDETRGEAAERHVHEALRAALPPEYRLYRNARWCAKSRPDGPAHDGEADLVIVHPELGLLVVEVKAGEPRRDATGRWWLGPNQLRRSPFEQAEAAKHDLRRALIALPDWPAHDELRAGHAVAFPDVDVASLPPGHALLGPDAPHAIVLDADSLATSAAARQAIERAYAYWVGDGTRGRAPGAEGMHRVDEYLAPTATLRRLLRHDVEANKDRLIQASQEQRRALDFARGIRRAEVVGPAGSGKSIVAVEKARRFAREGFRTLYVCFNQPLATAILRDVEQLTTDDPASAERLQVSTFHRLCETLGTQAGVLTPKPADPPRTWWDETLPAALLAGIDALPGERFHAIVVDEGQDFELAWLESLQFLLEDPEHDVLWVFHDPGQALFRDDRVAELGLPKLELFHDYRCPAPVSELAARFYHGPGEPLALAPGGLAPRLIVAAPGDETVDALRVELHRLTLKEGIRGWQIVVLSGRSATDSAVWRARTYGNQVLWNGAIDDAGRSLGLPADEVPDEPADVIRFETIRRFKGLEREVVVLCELPEAGERLDQLLYVGLTRATTQLVIIAPPELSQRLGRISM